MTNRRFINGSRRETRMPSELDHELSATRVSNAVQKLIRRNRRLMEELAKL